MLFSRFPPGLRLPFLRSHTPVILFTFKLIIISLSLVPKLILLLARAPPFSIPPLFCPLPRYWTPWLLPALILAGLLRG